MGFWSGTAFPNEKAVHWASSHEPTIWVLTAVYIALALYCPGRISEFRHGLLPTWYRYNGIFQLVLLVAVTPELLMVLANGWTESVCRTGSLYTGSFSGTILWLYVWSKVIDLAETLLIVLEGRRPLMLHVVHHSVSLIYVWHGYLQQHSTARWFVFANLFAHVVLYSYLSPKKFICNPCWLMVCITQMAQLFVAFGAIVTAQRVVADGGRCDVDPSRLGMDKLITAIFIVLFLDFYHVKYREFRIKRELQFKQELRSNNECRPNHVRGNEEGSEEGSDRTSKTKLLYRYGYVKTGITPPGGGYLSPNVRR